MDPYRIARLAVSRFGFPRDVAEDITQTVLLRCHARGYLDNPAYIYSAARNNARNYLRNEATRKAAMQAITEALATQDPRHGPIIATLSPTETSVALSLSLGYSQADTARRLGLSRKRVLRAIASMRGKLHAYCPKA